MLPGRPRKEVYSAGIFFLVLSFTSGGWSSDNRAQSLFKLLTHRLANARTLEARFLEHYFENGVLVRSEAGVAYFERPGKMRWEYERPEKNLFLVDGKYAWFYTPTDHTVTKAPASESADARTPLSLLAGDKRVSRVCARVQSVPEIPQSPGDVALECILRGSVPAPSAAGVSGSNPRVFLEITESGELAKILVQAGGGVQSEFLFKNWKFNPVLNKSLFHFEVPPGVVIVDGLIPSPDRDARN
jgi:outer membrane lipoprotein carrier protein